jgi:hypothetical protein
VHGSFQLPIGQPRRLVTPLQTISTDRNALASATPFNRGVAVGQRTAFAVTAAGAGLEPGKNDLRLLFGSGDAVVDAVTVGAALVAGATRAAARAVARPGYVFAAARLRIAGIGRALAVVVALAGILALVTAELSVAVGALDVGVRAASPVAYVVGTGIVIVTVGIATAFLAAVDAAQLFAFAARKVAGSHIAIAREAGILAHAIVGVAALLRFVAAGRRADLTHGTQGRLGCVRALALDAGV